MANYFSDNDDLVWQYKHGIRWEEIARLTELDYTLPGGHKNLEEARAFYDEVMHMVGDLAANEIAPRSARVDAEGVKLVNGTVVLPKEMEGIVNRFNEAGLLGMSIPRELGGSNCPLALTLIANEVMGRADVSIMSHVGFHGGTAIALMAFSAFDGSISPHPEHLYLGRTRFEKEIKDIVSGNNWGCMVLTEPDCGSDLAAIRTTATLRDGKWYLTGNKVFITSGHGQYELVLARSEPLKTDGAALDGLKGLSLFLVPRTIDGKENVRIDKIEHKMGHNASPTCSLVYEDSVGELIGKRGQGFELMLYMMNGARVSVGFEGIGLSESAFRMAWQYAQMRKTMGKAIYRHELVGEMLMDMELEIRGMRALAFECANYQELSTKYDLMLRYMPPKDTQVAERYRALAAKYKKRARDLTPLLKYAAGENAVAHARKNMQIHGGSGYMSEVGAEKLMRDALVIPVYEGTSQIQSLMVLKDRLSGVLRSPTKFARGMSRASLGMTTAKSNTEKSLYQAKLEVSRALKHLIGRVAGSKLRKELGTAMRNVPAHEWPRYITQDFMREWDMRADFSHALVHAERLTKILVDVEVASVLCKQATAHPERRKLADRYVKRMMPRVRALADEIREGDTTVLEWIEEREIQLGALSDETTRTKSVA